jgi:hypothetical protein
MKCIHCGVNSNRRERAGGRCKSCGRPFAFEPKAGVPLTDLSFRYAIDAVSDRGALRWTTDHLYYAAARRVRRRKLGHRIVRRKRASLRKSEFAPLLRKWEATHGVPLTRLHPDAFLDADEPALQLGDYTFEQLVVCDDDAIVDTLLANNFHADLRCPVLSYGGYPRQAYETIMRALRDRPPATVYVVHAADWDGCALATRVATETRWFGGGSTPRIVDVGLRPADAKRYRGQYQEATATVGPGEVVDENEAKWLSSHRLDLAAVLPRRLLGTLARHVRGEVATSPATIAAGVGVGVVWYADAWGDGDGDGDADVG